jgi:hypothetical protein
MTGSHPIIAISDSDIILPRLNCMLMRSSTCGPQPELCDVRKKAHVTEFKFYLFISHMGVGINFACGSVWVSN